MARPLPRTSPRFRLGVVNGESAMVSGSCREPGSRSRLRRRITAARRRRGAGAVVLGIVGLRAAVVLSWEGRWRRKKYRNRHKDTWLGWLGVPGTMCQQTTPWPSGFDKTTTMRASSGRLWKVASHGARGGELQPGHPASEWARQPWGSSLRPSWLLGAQVC